MSEQGDRDKHEHCDEGMRNRRGGCGPSAVLTLTVRVGRGHLQDSKNRFPSVTMTTQGSSLTSDLTPLSLSVVDVSKDDQPLLALT
ncbi:hypothetical protein F2P81_004023 [Scophthalmus maximus]|uniref:Uncharacterized protein n=1 Tax=Scophthalmus maximus TaxID=52904 RepID=A0A6A4T535_SCOMX|nr:hypothetical protein F2P81_004023 [Scophthalmus maximus]